MPADALQRSLPTLLIVDDDDIDIMSIRRSLKMLNLEYPTVIAHDGLEAFQVLRGEGRSPIKSPFVIMLDLNMPRMNGLEFLKALREDDDFADSVVFVLTTSSAERDKRSVWAHHVAGYIAKGLGDTTTRALQMIDRYCQIVQLPTRV